MGCILLRTDGGGGPPAAVLASFRRLQAECAFRGLDVQLELELAPGLRWRGSYLLSVDGSLRLDIDHGWLDYLRRDGTAEVAKCRDGTLCTTPFPIGIAQCALEAGGPEAGESVDADLESQQLAAR